MQGKRLLRFVAVCLSFMYVVPAKAQTWNFLGHGRIDGTLDHQKIQVTRRGGLFTAIQVRISGDAVFFDRVVIHFDNGTSQDVAIRDRIAPSAKNIFEFHGERRSVESVELWYFNQRWQNDPMVMVYGS